MKLTRKASNAEAVAGVQLSEEKLAAGFAYRLNLQKTRCRQQDLNILLGDVNLARVRKVN